MKIITLLVIRGLPGVGKTTLGNTVADVTFAADDFFTNPETGIYDWDPMKLSEAHASCFQNVKKALESCEFPVVAVTNVFAEKAHIRPYIDLIDSLNKTSGLNPRYNVFVIDLFDQKLTDFELSTSNIHHVPENSIARMRSRWEH